LHQFDLDNIDFRLDSEYFKKEYLDLDKKIDDFGYEKIGDFAYVTDGIHTSIDYCDSSNVRLLSAQSPKSNYFNLSRNVFISKKAHSLNPRTALKLGDIGISTVGTIGNCAVITEDIIPANCDRDLGIIRDTKGFFPNFLSTFLLTKFGRFQTTRESTGNVQLHLFLYKIRGIKVPKCSEVFQKCISELVNNAHELRLESKKLYENAENYLLLELEFSDLDKKLEGTENVNIKTYKSSYEVSGRLDAEFYQPMYDKIDDLINSLPEGNSKVTDEFEMNFTNYIPEKDKEYKYIELANISDNGVIDSYTLATGNDLPSRARRKVQTGDILVSSIEGSLDSCAIVTKNLDGAICSTGFYVLRPKKMSSEFALVLFKSKLIQNKLKQLASGTILTSINKVDFLNLKIPKVSQDIQLELQKDLILSSTALEKSNELLSKAIDAVELAVEKGEQKAFDFIERV